MNKAMQELKKKEERRQHELEQLAGFELRLNRPVTPKKPNEFKFNKDDVNSFEYPVAIGNTVVEKKSDGNCVLFTVEHCRKVSMFSSNSNEWNIDCFPELKDELIRLPTGYYHGELLGKAPRGVAAFTHLDEFVAVQKRPKTSTAILTPALVEQYPLKIDIFDVLMFGDRLMLDRPFHERRGELEFRVDEREHISLAKQWKAETKEELQKSFLAAIASDYEGLIAKDPNSLYVPGSRDNDWIKLKGFFTLDLAVLGFYETEKSRNASKQFSAVLAGTYNTETKRLETLVKVRIGAVSDQRAIYEMVKTVETDCDYNKVVKANPKITINPAMQKIGRKIPSEIVIGKMPVIEVKVLDVTYSDNWHSCGLGYDSKRAHSLRIATFKQLRYDKTRIQDITTTQQVHDYYSGDA